jgi:hypothetical protein
MQKLKFLLLNIMKIYTPYNKLGKNEMKCVRDIYVYTLNVTFPVPVTF